jgi:hypothetical protein
MRLSELGRAMEGAGRSGSLPSNIRETLAAARDAWAGTAEGLEVWFSGRDA